MANQKENEKDRARELYFTTSLRQATIAQQVGVSERTISTWVTEGNWRALKKAKYHSPQVEAQRLYEELRVISANISRRPPEQRFPTKEELDARTKLIALINSLNEVKGQWRNIQDEHDIHIPDDDQQYAPAKLKAHENSNFQ